MNDHVGIVVEGLLCIREDINAPGRIRRASDFSQVAPGFGGIQVDRADNFNGLLFAHQFCDGCTDGADTILNGANLLFHKCLRNVAVRCAYRLFWLLRKPLQ